MFTTAYDTHAVEAFDAGAVDYLLKPVQAARLAQTVARLQQRLATREPFADSIRWSSGWRASSTRRTVPARGACAG